MSNYFLRDNYPKVQQSIDFQFSRFQVPDRLKADLSQWKDSKKVYERELYEYAREYIDNFPDNLNRKGLYFWSTKAGLTKSSLAVAIAKQLILEGKTFYRPYFVIAEDLFSEFRQLHNEGIPLRSTQLFINYMRSDLIILDDLGVEKLSKFVAKMYYYLLNAMWAQSKSIIITSKFDMTDLFERAEPDVDNDILDNIVSRLNDMVMVIRFTGKDKRG